MSICSDFMLDLCEWALTFLYKKPDGHGVSMEGISKKSKGCSIFISYRRADSPALARWLAEVIQRTFGPDKVFIDIETIRVGEEWPEKIESALLNCSVFISVIGPAWLRLSDKYGRRRLDCENDWVRKEVSHALRCRKIIVPVLHSGASVPKKEALPSDLTGLASIQGFELREDRWSVDTNFLLDRLETFGFKRRVARLVRYPMPRVQVKELSENELASALLDSTDWSVVVSEQPGNGLGSRTELHRTFEFASFEDAMHFMSEASLYISKRDHHPRWENIWRTVSIWLSTWDIGNIPSQLDVNLALYLEKLREKFPPANPPLAKKKARR